MTPTRLKRRYPGRMFPNTSPKMVGPINSAIQPVRSAGNFFVLNQEMKTSLNRIGCFGLPKCFYLGCLDLFLAS